MKVRKIITKHKAKIDNKIFEIKKELVMREYDSLFTMLERQTNIVFSYRSWTISLLTGYCGFLLVFNIEIATFIYYFIPIFITLTFLILEADERSVIQLLINDLRALELIFMKTNLIKIKKGIMNYTFRDVRDIKVSSKTKVNAFLKALIKSQILS